MRNKITEFIKKEAVLAVSVICALITVVFMPPDQEYGSYIDWHVLCLLLCLMAVVEGVKRIGAFRSMTYQILKKINNGRILAITMVMLPFFSAMLVTNDVALLVFVPFTMALLDKIGCHFAVIPMLVLQTIGANLGSMATPVGNPQNLFLYSAFGLSMSEFLQATLSLTLVSLAGLLAASFFLLPAKLPPMALEKEEMENGNRLWIYGGLFVVCLLTVFHMIPAVWMTIIVIAVIFILDKKLLKDLDISLLATFICFFIVSGNLGRMEEIKVFLQGLLEKNTLLTSIATSQVISNVPAAVLLSGFTEDWMGLLRGVNIGGLGTPIASLASLITLKLYLRRKNAEGIRFLIVFLIANIIGLGILIAINSRL
ncbi:MAG: citrate transporter [Lachnospiraceae bacterium]|nr:citrate transporter [Lachnospiraceae bacterium]